MALQCDMRYVLSIPFGLSRLIQIVIGILVLICISSTAGQLTGYGYIYFVAVATLLTSLIYLIIFVIHLPESGVCMKLLWDAMEFFSTAVCCILYLVAGIIAAADSHRAVGFATNQHSAYGAAAFFCFAGVLVYGVMAYIYFRRWRVGSVTASSSITIERTTTTSAVRY